ncbi:MAG: shikimate dehydrogenase family protein [Allosphingosinicella sp.]|uniref:shikimate dehydrogenase family protein n=1 Tax=Allosphingosinicella sp. TaxID=2823234 RepID=UPI0039316D0C
MSVPYAELIGDPIEHSKSPLIHGFWLKKLGLAGAYRALRVTAAELPDYFARRRADPAWRGCNVTMPLKELVARELDDVDPLARRIGAVNAVHRRGEHLLGLNTDRAGLNLALGDRTADGDVVLVGAGGAARAAMEELRRARPRRLVVMNRTVEKAEALLAEFGCAGEARPIGPAPAADLLINASAMGMAGHPPLDIDLSAMRPGGAVLDMVYHPLDTALLRNARAAGLDAIDGLAMLIGQARFSFALFYGAEPPGAHDAELRELVTS